MKIPAATDAMVAAKKKALARKAQVSKEVREIIAAKIKSMIDDGVVSVLVSLTENQFQWGFPQVKAELEALAYKVDLVEDEDSETPDVEISIEYLK